MKRFFFAIIFTVAFACGVNAQNAVQQNTVQVQADSVSFQRAPLADSTLVGTTVFQLLQQEAGGGKVELSQPAEMEQAYGKYIKANGERKRNGYRIRLFFDNKQTARVESEELEKAFQEQFPQIPTYRSYTNPFFKVVVGDYRTKSDAIRELKNILPYYPKAIVVKENIYFPAI
jgi:hypothetical protein